ncbi:uncharacterized protein LOC110656310 [Hevea brasiliensis]|uniref:uncharacterized protein LOC110656310 n=1 Tax=Hevea brasiliensis TaxID=3981 RepID=UPI0025DF6434|nr:uncharacterized protein LOC110656310 [Hevea brasiliensis]
MASIQCCKPAEQSCNHGQQNALSEMVSSVFKKEQTHQGHTTSHCQIQCCSHTTATGQKNETHCSCQTLSRGMPKTQTACVSQTTGHEAPGQGLALATTNRTKCHRKSRSGEHKKRVLLQKIKDGISGHSDSDSSSSSSSESNSDDDKCGKNKN